MDYDRLGIPRVINGAGRLTALGGVALHADVIAAMAAGARFHVEMDLLKQRAGELIARMTGAEAGMVTAGASAGISIMAAAAVAGADPVRIRRLPDADWQPREILLQAGHAVHFGAPVTQMIRLGGGQPVLVGDVNHVTRSELASRLGSATAAFLYVQSHHTVHKGMLSLKTCLEACRERGVPVLVDAAAEEDLQLYINMGADLVTYSGGKAFGGPTSGIIAGRADLVQACRAQEAGIARGMKVGKETILGLLAALERFCAADSVVEQNRQIGLISALEAGLSNLPHTRLSRLPDEAGREIVRLGLTLDEENLGFTAGDLLRGLQAGSPAIVLRGHRANTGTVAIDPRPLEEADAAVIVERIHAFYQARSEGGVR